MELHGWGRYPKLDVVVALPLSTSQCISLIEDTKTIIARGLGRSYGDSSLASYVLDTRYLNHFIAFDETTGLLRCASGVSLDDILNNFVPRGWFLPVTPGTCFVTVGGAIASDVHGKNHHIDGTFTDHVTEIELLLGDGEQVFISQTNKPELFQATCGGMGLTGIILSATLRLKPIKSSNIIETTIKAQDLDAVLTAFNEHETATYSVAWIDCLARGKNLGRSVLMLGEHAEDGSLSLQKRKSLSIPFDMPSSLLSHATVRIFNPLYYATKRSHTRKIRFEQFFYPLDKLNNWNRLYGKSGFIQYQFVLPGVAGLREVLECIAASGSGSFLAVLKVCGKANQNYLSFPMEGYSLALDFNATPAVLQLLNELDKLVLKHGGRLYLAKDARMNEATFKQSYPSWQQFEEVREQYSAIGKFASIQSCRLGLK